MVLNFSSLVYEHPAFFAVLKIASRSISLSFHRTVQKTSATTPAPFFISAG
jgi:hypothetical protein